MMIFFSCLASFSSFSFFSWISVFSWTSCIRVFTPSRGTVDRFFIVFAYGGDGQASSPPLLKGAGGFFRICEAHRRIDSFPPLLKGGRGDFSATGRAVPIKDTAR